MIFVAFDVLRDGALPKVAATFSIVGVFSFPDESSQFEGSGWRSRLFRKRLFQPRFLAFKTVRRCYHCARQPRRGLWNTSMDLPSSYSIPRFSNHELTD